MTNTATVEKAGEHKEKMEKRRALGRGLESLLPGLRVVTAPPVKPAVAPPATSENATASPTTEAGAAGEQQIPRFARNDNQSGAGVEAPEPAVIPTLHAAVEDEAEREANSPAQDETAAAPAWPEESQGEGGESISLMAQAESRVPTNLVIQLPIGSVAKNPFQTRHVDTGEALDELANSIRANGVLQPIVVRPSAKDGRYILILGERRLLASQRAGKETIPAVVRRVSEQQAAEMTIIENLQRQDLSPLEQAKAFRVLSEEFKLTQAQIGERVGLSRESVANYMRLLRLPLEVMNLLAEKRLTFEKAKELLRLQSNDQIAEAALFAVKKGMNLEQIEQLVMRMEGLLNPLPGMPGTKKASSGARWVDPNVRAAQMELERLLGLRVRIRDRKGKGRIVIEYSTVDDYERVVAMLKAR
jgi:ParB family transcriptional regulator, chromosome partitioning protein